MVRVFGRKDETEHWLYRLFHLGSVRRTSPRGDIFRSNKATTSAIEHLKQQHCIGCDGPLKVSHITSRKRPIDALFEDGYDGETAAENYAAITFDHNAMKASFLRRIIAGSIPFNKIESSYFHDFASTLNPRSRGCLPSRTTIRRWLERAYDQ